MKIKIFLLQNKFIRFFYHLLRYYLKINFNNKKISKKLCNNIENIHKMNIDINKFSQKNKKFWISWIARLKNAWDFLYKCIESHINFYDEIILVNNNSTDNTEKVCKKLQKKYPKKIKYFKYEYDVYPAWSKKHKNTPSNSIHSLAYYYNWSFSKSSYCYVWKIDDDNYMIKEKLKNLRNYILKNKKIDTYFYYSWINIVKKENKYYTISDLNFKYSWFWWDHWIFPINPYTYFIQSNECEIFLNNLKWKWFWIIFYHLKFLKPNYWFSTIDKILAKKYINKIKNFIRNNKLKKIKNFKI